MDLERSCVACGEGAGFPWQEWVQLDALGFHGAHYTCGECRRPLPPGETAVHDGPGAPVCPACRAFRARTPCRACAAPLADAAYVLALGHYWHAAHFACAGCGSPIAGEYSVVAGAPYCAAGVCAAAVALPRCPHCLAPVFQDDPAVSFLNCTYHAAHFGCVLCSTPFQPGDDLLRARDRLYCTRHAAADLCALEPYALLTMVSPHSNSDAGLPPPHSASQTNVAAAAAAAAAATAVAAAAVGTAVLPPQPPPSSSPPAPTDVAGDDPARTRKPGSAKRASLVLKKEVTAPVVDSLDSLGLWDNRRTLEDIKWRRLPESAAGSSFVDEPGYNFEVGGEWEDVRTIADADLSASAFVAHFGTVLAPLELEHYFVKLSDMVVIATIEVVGVYVTSLRKYAHRALYRGSMEDVRVLLLLSSSSKRKRLAALREMFPAIAERKTVEFAGSKPQALKFAAELVSFERRLLSRQFKIGVLYWKEGQRSESEIYSNDRGSALFDAFLSVLGDRVELAGWKYYRGGLDSVHGHNGSHSYYAERDGAEVMFHVGPCMPASVEENSLGRKRHIGNDIVVIVFRDRDNGTQLPATLFESHFNHVFCLVTPHALVSGAAASYRVHFAYKPGVTPSLPHLPPGGVLDASDPTLLRRFLLSKLMHCELGALRAPQFASGVSRTRKALLSELASTHCPMI